MAMAIVPVLVLILVLVLFLSSPLCLHVCSYPDPCTVHVLKLIPPPFPALSAWHAACLSPAHRRASQNSALAWACPHHSCALCGRKAAAAGLIFRCEMCDNAYCEDCLPEDVEVRRMNELTLT